MCRRNLESSRSAGSAGQVVRERDEGAGRTEDWERGGEAPRVAEGRSYPFHHGSARRCDQATLASVWDRDARAERKLLELRVTGAGQLNAWVQTCVRIMGAED
jgi:hypothetical protein